MRVFLENVPDRYAFYLKNGKKLLNVEQLAKELKTMEHDVFYHHVTNDRNDFHNWIRDVVLDLELAEKILNAKNPADAKKVVEDRIKFIKSVAKAVKKAPATAAKKPKGKKTTKLKEFRVQKIPGGFSRK